jgi:alpha-tubulin suppressor-like RCC1 family protein
MTLPVRRMLACVALVCLALSCYRPRVVDCVLACDVRGCPDGMTCSAGLCTRGATCALAVAAGARHSCAVVGNPEASSGAGQIRCWGNNAYGQLGIDSTTGRGADGAPFIPVDLGAGRTVAADTSAISAGTSSTIAAGGRHTCALATDATSRKAKAVCWGDNTLGQLGLADGRARGAQAGDALDVVPIAGSHSIVAVTAGLYHTCARLDDASVVCWGDNRFGQLGVAGEGNATFAAVNLGEPARMVSAGAYHSCALLASGAVRCWGWNDSGQLGGDLPAGSATDAVAVTVAIPPASAIAAGAFHTCAVLATGAVTCWGQNDAGQLGVLREPNAGIGVPGKLVDLGGGRSARAIAAGASHTCALLDDFSVKCWGFNEHGELGVGDSSNRGDDEPLGDGLPVVTLAPDPVSVLAVGSNHACAIQAAGVRCWGLNDSGRLGVGDNQDRGADPSQAIGLVHLGTSRP